MAGLSAFVTKNYNAIKSVKASQTSLFDNKLGNAINGMLESDSIFKIYTDDFDLKFDCVDCSFSMSSEIPQFPLDRNAMISDNVIVGNLQFSCNLIVDYDYINEFWEVLKIGNLSNNGFTIETISQYEKNMFWNSSNYTESSDNVGSVYLSLSFIKVEFVEPKTGFLSYTKVVNPVDASKQGAGKVNVNVKEFEGKKLNDVNKSLLFKMIYG